MELNLRTRVKFFVNFHILPSPRINNRAIRDLEIWRLLVHVEISLEKFTEGGQFPEISSDFERRSNGKLAKISIKTWNFIFKLVEKASISRIHENSSLSSFPSLDRHRRRTIKIMRRIVSGERVTSLSFRFQSVLSARRSIVNQTALLYWLCWRTSERKRETE